MTALAPPSLLLVLGAVTFAGCPSHEARPPSLDGGDDGDGGMVVGDVDTDGDGLPDSVDDDDDDDGLCDSTEDVHNTDPLRADTDSDGYPDVVEVYSLYTDGTSPQEPAREYLTFLTERRDAVAEASAEVEITVRGRGESYYAAVESFSNANDYDERATSFLAGLYPLRADPFDNVAATTDTQFQVVLGRTRLLWRVDFRFDPARQAAQLCMRAFSYQLWVKRDMGVYTIQRRYLVVGPPGVVPADHQWCAPRPPCR